MKEWYDKKWWTADETDEFFENKREEMVRKCNKNKLKYEALVVTICGHIYSVVLCLC